MVEVDNKTVVRLQLWDIAGQVRVDRAKFVWCCQLKNSVFVFQERFGSMTRVYYRDADAAVIMFDLTAQRTFDAVSKWKADVDDKVPKTKHCSNNFLNKRKL